MRTKSTFLVPLGKFFIPILLGLGHFIIIASMIDQVNRFKYWSLITGYFFPPLGKETIIPTGILVFGFDPIFIALSIAYVDIIVALFLVWNYDLAKQIPFVGKFMIKVEEKGKSVEEKYGWVKPLRFIGIVLFVMVPFQGSGGLVGSIVGRLIGMKPTNIFYAITIGAVIGCLLIAMFSQAFLIFAEINTTLTFILIAGVIIVAITYYMRKKIKTRK